MSRQDDGETLLRNDESDTTPKFVLIGVRSADDAAPGTGAGTPAREWNVELSISNSHDEQSQTFRVPNRVVTTGSGRFENFGGVLRLPVASRLSLEAAFSQRAYRATDLVNLGGSNYQFDEEIALFAQRVDAVLGLRRRFHDAELFGGLRFSRPEGRYNTALAFRRGRTSLFGPALEGRVKLAAWRLSLSGETMSANMPVEEQRVPDFAHVTYHSRARFSAAWLSAERSWGGTDVAATVGVDRSRLPFVVMAVLGEEIRYFDQGYRPVSTTREVSVGLSARRRIAPGIHVRAYMAARQGSETDALTDPAGQLPDVSIRIRRGGRSPVTTFLLGGGADFSIGRPDGR